MYKSLDFSSFHFSERDNKMTSKYGQNLTNVIARFCYNHIPKSCDHGLLNESLARPCTVLESYVSSSEYVTLELRNIESTVLQYVLKINPKIMELFLLYQCLTNFRSISGRLTLNCGTNLSIINKMALLFILNTNAKGNSLVTNWKDATWENSEVSEIFSCLVAEELLI